MPGLNEDIISIGLDAESITEGQYYTGQEKEDYSNAYRGMWFPAFRQYNEALANWLKGITLQKHGSWGMRQEVKVVYTTPMRAYSKYIVPLVEGTVDMPIIIFNLTGLSFNMSRQFLPTNVQWTKQWMNGFWRIGPKAMPYDLNYSISCYCQHYYDADQIDWHILSRFQPLSYVTANGALSAIKLNSFLDASTVEAEKDQRLVRRDYQITVEGWLPLPYTDVSTAGTIGVPPPGWTPNGGTLTYWDAINGIFRPVPASITDPDYHWWLANGSPAGQKTGVQAVSGGVTAIFTDEPYIQALIDEYNLSVEPFTETEVIDKN